MDDHLYLAVGGDSVEFSQDLLYEIDTTSGVAFYDASEKLPAELEPHRPSGVVATQSLDPEGNLYLVVGGGRFGNKHVFAHPDDAVPDALRVLKWEGDVFSEVSIFASPAPKAYMSDVKLIDAYGGDELRDILVTVINHGDAPYSGADWTHPVLLRNATASKRPSSAAVARGRDEVELVVDEDIWAQAGIPDGLNTVGAVVGNFDGEGMEDVILLHNESGDGLYDHPVIYQNVDEGGAHTFQNPEDPPGELTHQLHWQPYGEGDQSRHVFDGLYLDPPGGDPCLVLAAQVPSVLDNLSSGGTISFAQRPWPFPGPFTEPYTSLALLVADLDGDDDHYQEMLFTDEPEQNRMWRGGPGLEPIEEATNDAFPADGSGAPRVIVKDFAGDAMPDLIAVNMDRPPMIYVNEPYGASRRLVSHPEMFDASWLVAEDGAWDGELADIDQDGDDDLVLASGEWAGNTRANKLYLWNEDANRFEFEANFPTPIFQYNTRNVAVADYNGDTLPDVAFANDSFWSDAYVCPNQGPPSYFTGLGCLNIPNGASSYHAVAFVDVDDDGLLDLMGGGLALSGGVHLEIHIYYNEHIQQNHAPSVVIEVSTEAHVGRFVPMNFDDPTAQTKDDLLVALKGPRNLVLQHIDEAPWYLVHQPEDFHQPKQSYRAHVVDFDDDGLDDVLSANFEGEGRPATVPTKGLRLFLNRYDGVQVDFEEKSAELFGEGFPSWYYEAVWDVAAAELFHPGRLDTIAVMDGQNRLLSPRAAYVDVDNVVGPWEGTQDHPFQYIQDAVDAAGWGWSIYVAAGEYPERVTLKPGLALYGGYDAEDWSRDIEGNETVIVHDWSEPIPNNYTVIAADETRIDGFTILGFDGIQSHDCSPTIVNNTIEVENVGLYTSNDAHPLVARNRFFYNNANNGIECWLNAHPTIVNNLIVGNAEDGICIGHDAHPLIANNTIYLNGDVGIGCYAQAQPLIQNNIIVANGAGIRCRELAAPEIRYNDLYANGGANYDGCDPGVGDLAQDPLFVSPGLPDDDYRLQADSPCIDMGTDEDAPFRDFEGAPRRVDLPGVGHDGTDTTDVGAFEHPLPSSKFSN